ncbi:MAG: glycosyltransferase family 1 protein [Planctomycetes bacterium]|nr:glycosyltransferase family 1 protein [Planctomycetota bacterium]
MVRRPWRIATTTQLERSVRAAGFEAFVLPASLTLDCNNAISQRLAEGPMVREFLERHDIDLLLDFNGGAFTLLPNPDHPGQAVLTNAALNIPYVVCYLDPLTGTMAQLSWADQWQLFESRDWIKWVWERSYAEELGRLGVPNIITMPMAVSDDDFDTSPLPEPDAGAAVAFMGHPASSWFRSQQPIASGALFPALTAAAVNADMPHLPFHKIYYDLYGFGEPPRPGDDFGTRVTKALDYYNHKFAYSAYLAVKQRDRFARFLKHKLGDAFELIGDHWAKDYELPHTPRIWDRNVLHERMRRVPICLNLMKGSLEANMNVRHFEITGYGGFMLTYYSPELSDCFEIGVECDVFRNEAELLEKIAFYLAHPGKRREIAAAGQRRTLSQHLYSHRLVTLVDLLRQAGVLPRGVGQVGSPPAAPTAGQGDVPAVAAPVGFAS